MQADLICANCKHYNGDLTCKAFPKGIPEVIISGESDHSEPLPKQENKIVFEPVKEE
jgi:hypothetical protein